MARTESLELVLHEDRDEEEERSGSGSGGRRGDDEDDVEEEGEEAIPLDDTLDEEREEEPAEVGQPPAEERERDLVRRERCLPPHPVALALAPVSTDAADDGDEEEEGGMRRKWSRLGPVRPSGSSGGMNRSLAKVYISCRCSTTRL